MNPDDKQTVTDDPAAADTSDEGKEATPEATGAQDTETDWDELLSESQPDTKPKPEPEAETKDTPSVSRAEFDTLRDAITKRDVNDALNGAVATIKGQNDDLKNVNDRLIRHTIIGLADQHPGILTAFGNRHNDPGKWKRAQAMIGKELAADLADRPDAKLTEDAQAAADAVRGVSNTLPADETKKDNAFYTAQSDNEFAAQLKKDIAAAGG